MPDFMNLDTELIVAGVVAILAFLFSICGIIRCISKRKKNKLLEKAKIDKADTVDGIGKPLTPVDSESKIDLTEVSLTDSKESSVKEVACECYEVESEALTGTVPAKVLESCCNDEVGEMGLAEFYDTVRSFERCMEELDSKAKSIFTDVDSKNELEQSSLYETSSAEEEASVVSNQVSFKSVSKHPKNSIALNILNRDAKQFNIAKNPVLREGTTKIRVNVTKNRIRGKPIISFLGNLTRYVQKQVLKNAMLRKARSDIVLTTC